MFKKRRSVASLALALLTPMLTSCGSDASPGGSAPPSGGASTAEERTDTELETEVRRRFQRPELKSYLMLPDSFIGGDFPRKTAVLLREVQELVNKHVTHLEASGSPNQGVLEAHRAFEKFAGLTAELYELMAAQPTGTVRAMRTGLEITDAALQGEYNRRVDEVNAAHDRFDRAIRALPSEQQASFSRMAVTTRLKGT